MRLMHLTFNSTGELMNTLNEYGLSRFFVTTTFDPTNKIYSAILRLDTYKEYRIVCAVLERSPVSESLFNQGTNFIQLATPVAEDETPVPSAFLLKAWREEAEKYFKGESLIEQEIAKKIVKWAYAQLVK